MNKNMQMKTSYKGINIFRFYDDRRSKVLNETHFDGIYGSRLNRDLSKWLDGIKVNCMQLKHAKAIVDFAIKEYDRERKEALDISHARNFKIQEESILAEIDERNV